MAVPPTLSVYDRFLVLAMLHGMWDLSSPTRIEPGPCQWKRQVLTTGPPGKSLCVHLVTGGWIRLKDTQKKRHSGNTCTKCNVWALFKH